jgi:hypothetical protein
MAALFLEALQTIFSKVKSRIPPNSDLRWQFAPKTLICPYGTSATDFSFAQH